MKIIILSKYFYPNVGGLEVIAWICLNEFIRQGHEVRLITESTGEVAEEASFGIFRKVGYSELIRHLRWSDVVFHNDAAIRYLPALLWTKKPYVVYMSGYIFPGSSGWIENGAITWRRHILTLGFRLLLARASGNIAACAAVAAGNQVPARIIPNPFDPTQFGQLPKVNRDKFFLFAGRVVSIKGVDDIIRALGILAEEGLRPAVTVAGPGVFDEKGSETSLGRELITLAQCLGVVDQLSFTGPQSKMELRQRMNEHRVLLVPSKWNEPIGIVSLEAIACGCVVIGTNGGGLAVSIGPCGLTYPNGDCRSLAKCMSRVLNGEIALEKLLTNAHGHLENYLPGKVCEEFLAVLDKARSN